MQKMCIFIILLIGALTEGHGTGHHIPQQQPIYGQNSHSPFNGPPNPIIPSTTPSTVPSIPCGEFGECVQHDQCDNNNRIITDGRNSIDTRFDVCPPKYICCFSDGNENGYDEDEISTIQTPSYPQSQPISTQPSQQLPIETQTPSVHIPIIPGGGDGMNPNDGSNTYISKMPSNSAQFPNVPSNANVPSQNGSQLYPPTQSQPVNSQVRCDLTERCVPHDQCDNNNRIITDGGNHMDTRFNIISLYNLGCPANYKCCVLDEEFGDSETLRTPSYPSNTSTQPSQQLPVQIPNISGGGVGMNKNDDNNKYNSNPIQPQPNPFVPLLRPATPPILPSNSPQYPNVPSNANMPSQNGPQLYQSPQSQLDNSQAGCGLNETCVPYDQCDNNNRIITDGRDKLDPRFAIGDVKCPVNYKCCALDEEVPDSESTTLRTLSHPSNPPSPPIGTQTSSVQYPINSSQIPIPTEPTSNVLGGGVGMNKNDDNNKYNPTQVSTDHIQTPTNETYPCQFGSECMPYYQCAKGTIITDGEGVLDIRFGQEENIDPQRHPCPGLFNTCCSLRAETPNIPKIPVNVGCGIRNINGVGFTISGAMDGEAQFGEFPWTIAITEESRIYNDQVIKVYICGGSLIEPGVVLTAAHCVHKISPKFLRVRAGEWDTQTRNEIFQHQDRTVADYVIHPDFNSQNMHNDVALLFLTQPFELAPHINTICLPNSGDVFDHARCFASGWGKDLFGKDGKYQVILKRVEVPIVPHYPCQQKLRQTKVGTYFRLNRTFVCAGGEGHGDTCKGDGGSPLACPVSNGRFVQTGIVSWGIGCNNTTPGVYVNVAKFRQWIDEQLVMNNFDTNSYLLQ